jgi:hypothetical protein
MGERFIPIATEANTANVSPMNLLTKPLAEIHENWKMKHTYHVLFPLCTTPL